MGALLNRVVDVANWYFIFTFVVEDGLEGADDLFCVLLLALCMWCFS